jgi:class 3 adenylate cyclase
MTAGTAPIDPRLTEPHLSNRIVWPFIEILVERFGREATERMVAEAGLPLSYLEDRESWQSIEFLLKLQSAVAREAFGLEALPGAGHPMYQLWREAGHRSFERRHMGPVHFFARALGSAGMVYASFSDLARRGNTVSTWKVTRVGTGHCVVRVEAPAGTDTVGACWNRVGVLEGIPTLWGLPRARVTHERCACDPGHPADACEYDVRYRDRPLAAALRPLGAALLGAMAGLVAVMLLEGGASASVLPWTLAGAGLGLSASLVRMVRRVAAEKDEETERFAESLSAADRRVKDLWEGQVSLRRALLINRKIVGYLPGPVVEEILADPERELALGGERRDAVVLFVDIVDYTRRCEGTSPERVVDELNLFFRHMDAEILESGGVLDKRMGDAIMVVFVPKTAFEGRRELARRAVRCALFMRRALVRCNEALSSRGDEPMEVRVGIAAGPLVQGNIGSDLKLEYTVIGDTVNLASRLEKAAEPGEILMAGDVYDHASDLLGEVRRGSIPVKGKAIPVDVVGARGGGTAPRGPVERA